jgi:hypothetical protein
MYFWSFAALKRGARVGYDCCFVQAKGILIAQCASARGTNSAPPCSAKTYNTIGDWINVKNRYLGVIFPIHGKTHYGWARLSVQVSRKPFQATAILTGYAYETIPNKPIIAGQTKGLEQRNKEDFDASDSLTIPSSPQPASLGALAMGAPGLSIWRRESVGAAHAAGVAQSHDSLSHSHGCLYQPMNCRLEARESRISQNTRPYTAPGRPTDRRIEVANDARIVRLEAIMKELAALRPE